MEMKRKLLIWLGLAILWVYLLINSSGVLRIAAVIMLAVSIAVPILDAALTRGAQCAEQQSGNPTSTIPNPK